MDNYNELFAKHREKNFITKFDISNAYYQIPIPSHTIKTTLSEPHNQEPDRPFMEATCHRNLRYPTRTNEGPPTRGKRRKQTDGLPNDQEERPKSINPDSERATISDEWKEYLDSIGTESTNTAAHSTWSNSIAEVCITKSQT